LQKLLVALLLGFSGNTYSAESTPPYPDLLLDDIQYVVSEPAHWQATEWKNFGWSALAVAGTAILLDGQLHDALKDQSGNSIFMLQIERFGAEYSMGVVAAFYLSGSLADNETAVLVAQDGLTASIIASGLIAPVIKISTGRSRPYENAGTYNFQGLGANKLNTSFPSGHTTEAFALASVISSHYEEAWIKNTAYTVASLVGIARIYNDAHFASDVLAGALIGNWVGKSVVEHNRTRRSTNIVLLPQISPNLTGLRLTGNF